MSKLFSIIIAIVLSLPIAVWAVDAVAPQETAAPQEAERVVNTLDEDVDDVQIDFKEPVGTKNIAKKFLAAMGGVAISSFLLFFMLTLYNRVRENVKNKVKTPDGETSLETPDDLSSAVKTFLEKTKWE